MRHPGRDPPVRHRAAIHAFQSVMPFASACTTALATHNPTRYLKNRTRCTPSLSSSVSQTARPRVTSSANGREPVSIRSSTSRVRASMRIRRPASLAVAQTEPPPTVMRSGIASIGIRRRLQAAAG